MRLIDKEELLNIFLKWMKIDIGDTSWANTHFKGGGCLQTTAYDYPPKEAQP